MKNLHSITGRRTLADIIAEGPVPMVEFERAYLNRMEAERQYRIHVDELRRLGVWGRPDGRPDYRARRITPYPVRVVLPREGTLLADQIMITYELDLLDDGTYRLRPR